MLRASYLAGDRALLMWTANLASTIFFCKMSDSNHNSVFSVCSLKNQVKNLIFVVFQIPTYCISTHVGNLNHAGKLAIHE